MQLVIRPARPSEASHIAGKIHSRPSPPGGSATRSNAIAKMSTIGTTATQPAGMRVHGTASAAMPPSPMMRAPRANSSGRWKTPLTSPTTNITATIPHNNNWLAAAARSRRPNRCASRRERRSVVSGARWGVARLKRFTPRRYRSAAHPPARRACRRARESRQGPRPEGHDPCRKDAADQRPESFSRRAASASSSARVPPPPRSEVNDDDAEVVSVGAFASASRALATATLCASQRA